MKIGLEALVDTNVVRYVRKTYPAIDSFCVCSNLKLETSSHVSANRVLSSNRLF
jgi:hypothetical protein